MAKGQHGEANWAAEQLGSAKFQLVTMGLASRALGSPEERQETGKELLAVLATLDHTCEAAEEGGGEDATALLPLSTALKSERPAITSLMGSELPEGVDEKMTWAAAVERLGTTGARDHGKVFASEITSEDVSDDFKAKTVAGKINRGAQSPAQKQSTQWMREQIESWSRPAVARFSALGSQIKGFKDPMPEGEKELEAVSNGLTVMVPGGAEVLFPAAGPQLGPLAYEALLQLVRSTLGVVPGLTDDDPTKQAQKRAEWQDQVVRNLVVGAVWLRGVFPEVTSLSTGLGDTVGQKIILQSSQILQRGANGRSGNANKYTEHWVGNGGQSAFDRAMSKADESVRALVERLKGDVNRQG